MKHLTLLRKAIRCHVCDKLLATEDERIAKEDCLDIHNYCCDDCYKKYWEKQYERYGGTRMCRFKASYKKGERIPDKEWMIVERYVSE